MPDLFSTPAEDSAKNLKQKDTTDSDAYAAEQIEILEGLEPVRHRPGMYIGGTDSHAMHHLVAEVLDNSMDEVVGGHASRIDVHLGTDNRVTISDNGRGIPTDSHPKFEDKSALEVILTTLHSGGKFHGKAYEISGGLHGVGLSVVNALSSYLRVEVMRQKQRTAMVCVRGVPQGPLEDLGSVSNRRGTIVSFTPDRDIFGDSPFDPARLFRMVRSRAYLFRGVHINWSCDAALLTTQKDTPNEAVLHFPAGLSDYLSRKMEGRALITPTSFSGQAKLGDKGKVEWAIAWPVDENGECCSYCNTVPTPLGGTHESGMRSGILKAVKNHGTLIGHKQVAKITADDLLSGAEMVLSIFIPDPLFQGQTKEKLASNEATRWVENALRDHMEHWLSTDKEVAASLLDHAVERARERQRVRETNQTKRQSATRKLRLPGKLADCTVNTRDGTELFIVEGDSAGGSAKQARLRQTQAILPLRGKILNVASATRDKQKANQELKDLTEALGCGAGSDFNLENLRYDKVIIMTDADVDGAHIAALLMTFFFQEMSELVRRGHLYLAQPPLYRMQQGNKAVYARDDAHREELLKTTFNPRQKIDVSRFKGLGEMPPHQLKETTMDPNKRMLLKVDLPRLLDDADRQVDHETRVLVETLMGKKPEKRFRWLQDNAAFAAELDI